jgi:hypothetical protein
MPRLVMLIVAFLVLSLLSDGASRPRAITGNVIEWKAGQLISVVNEQTDPDGVSMALRDTAYESDPGAIKPGVQVTIEYKLLGERRPVATRLTVLNRDSEPIL